MNNYKKPNKQRIETVFRHEMPDRVPNFEVLVENPTFNHVMGREMEASHTLANIDPADYIEFANKVGQDVIGMCFYDSPLRYEQDGELKALDFRITSRADLDRVVFTDLEHLELSFRRLDDYAAAIKGTDIGLFVLTGTFFCDAYTAVFGFENFMCMLYDDRDLIEEVLEQYADYYARLVEKLVDYPLTFLYVGDDVAFKSGTLIAPDLMREMWVPRMQRLFAPAVDKDIPILFHSDGNIEELLPDLIEMGAAAINPIEPYGMDIRDVKKRFGKDLALVGNMDVGGALSEGTPEQVRQEAAQLIDDVGQDSGFVLASCHSITGNVKPENYLAMVDTAQTHGVY